MTGSPRLAPHFDALDRHRQALLDDEAAQENADRTVEGRQRMLRDDLTGEWVAPPGDPWVGRPS